jgi:hypothetical protein
MRQGKGYLQSRRIILPTWWVIYLQDIRRPRADTKNIGSGARYALQTFMGTHAMVVHQFGPSLARAFEQRADALTFLEEMNLVDEVMNS